jgi:hypothetical protein
VPSKEGYAMDVFHFLGCYIACGRGLYWHGDSPDNRYFFPCLTPIRGSVKQLDG